MIEITHVMAGGCDLECKASVGMLAMFCLQRPLQHTTPSDYSTVMILSICTSARRERKIKIDIFAFLG